MKLTVLTKQTANLTEKCTFQELPSGLLDGDIPLTVANQGNFICSLIIENLLQFSWKQISTYIIATNTFCF
jgi:hypothetical protein